MLFRDVPLRKDLHLNFTSLISCKQLPGRWCIEGGGGQAVKRQEALGGNLLQWLQQVPGGQEGTGLCAVADEQQAEWVGVEKKQNAVVEKETFKG